MGYMTEEGRKYDMNLRDIEQLQEVLNFNQKVLFHRARYPEFFAHQFNSMLEHAFTSFSFVLFKEALNNSTEVFNMITDIPDFLEVLLVKKLTSLG